MFLAVALTVFLLGGVWVYLIPLIQAQVPASWQTNKIAQIAVVGAMLFITLMVVGFVRKGVGLRLAA